MVDITLEQFGKMIPRNRDAGEWFKVAKPLFKKYKINTVNRIAGFMAQTGHESADYTILEENLRYSADALMRVFGKRYFKSKAMANDYAYNPQKIANYVYMDKNRSKRGALGNVKDGDGWKFRGRGVKQLTGRNNYEKFGKAIGMDADDVAEYIETKQGALESALWFWETNNLERYADNDDIVGMSKRVNGGKIGLQERMNRYSDAKKIMLDESSSKISPQTPLKRGSRGPDVVKLQKALKIRADGIFGIGTAAALKNWQRKHGLIPDGVAGTKTLEKMFK